jgi:hypothetical protein
MRGKELLEKDLLEGSKQARKEGKYDIAFLLEELVYQLETLGRLEPNLVKGFPWHQ